MVWRLTAAVVPGERSRVEYPQVDRSVLHARIDSIPDNAIIPDWLKPALAQPSTA